MKIDEGSINHNAMLRIKEVTSAYYDMDKDEPFLLIAMLGEVVATVEFADQMKELLKL